METFIILASFCQIYYPRGVMDAPRATYGEGRPFIILASFCQMWCSVLSPPADDAWMDAARARP